MKKSLLMGLMALSTSLSGYAFDAGEYVYTPQGRFQITGENICTNGTCSANFDGWTAISATAGAEAGDIFQYNPDNMSFNSVTNAVGEGMYYQFNLPSQSATYVVSLQIRQQTPAYPYGTNVYYTTDATTNTNVYGTTGSSAAGHNFLSVFGNTGAFTSNDGFVNFGSAVMIPKDWETVAFAVTGAGLNYYIAMSQMDPTVEIRDVQIQEAVQVADLRQREGVLMFAKALLNAKDWEQDSEEYIGLAENIEAVEVGITDESPQEELDAAIEGLNEALITADGQGFLGVNMDNFLTSSCKAETYWPTYDAKVQKASAIGDWTLSNKRWFHCNVSQNTAENRAPLLPYIDAPNFGYGNGMIGTQYCRMVKTLHPGTYIFAMDGQAYTMYKSNVVAAGTASNYLHNNAIPTGLMELYVKVAEGTDTLAINTVALPTTTFATNVIVAKIETAGEYEIGVNLSQKAPEGYSIDGVCKGGTYTLTNPRLYCSLEGYDADQLAYIEKVRKQIDAAANAYANAEALRDSVELPWLKKEMADTMAVMKPRVDFYNTLTDEEIINGFVDPVSGVANNGYADMTADFDQETGNPKPKYNAADSIMNNGVRPMQYFNDTYTKVNSIFVNLNTSINLAKQTVDLPIYSTSTGKPALETAITTAESLYKDKAANGVYQLNAGKEVNADSVAVVNSKVALDDAVATFKASVPASSYTTIVDIDFSGEAVLDEATSLYSIAGNKGSMEFSYFTTTAPTENKDIPFQTGIDNNGVRENADVLRVGNGTGTVVVDPAEYSDKLVRVTFDYYFGYPNAGSAGFYLQNEADEDVAALFFSLLSNAVTTNTFGFDVSKLYDIKNVNDLDIYVEKNKTSFEIVLDYISNTMYAVATNTSKGISKSETLPLPGKFTKFIVKSDYKNYHSRRCWFDNLKIETVAVDMTGVAGVTEVSEAADEAIYNVAGQKVSAPVKGQIYVKKGAAFVK